MKRITSIAVAIIIMMVAAGARASAVLIDTQGKVDVAIAGKKVPPTIGLALADGSVVSAGSGGRASVLTESGSLAEVTAGHSYTVGKNANTSRTTSLGSGIALAMKEMAASGEGPTVHGMVKKVEGPRGRLGGFGSSSNALVGTYPVGTAVVLGPTITFLWSRPIGGAWPKPAIVIADSRDRQLAVRSVSEKGTSYRVCPCNIKVRKGGDYSWYFASEQGGVKGKSARFSFSTLSNKAEGELNEQKRKIDGLGLSPDGRALLIAQLLFRYNLMDDMVKTLTPVWKKAKSPFVRKLLYNGYARMGRMDEAKRYE